MILISEFKKLDLASLALKLDEFLFFDKFFFNLVDFSIFNFFNLNNF